MNKLNPKSLAIIGTQWGDEGKGKITDYFATDVDMVVRYQGGANAGHTIKFDDKEFALNLLPSGVFNPNTMNVLATGVVIDIAKLIHEIITLKKQGLKGMNIVVSDRAHVVFSYHKYEDALYEDLRPQEDKIGTTKKGIGHTYSDKAMRSGIRVADLFDKVNLKKLITTNLKLRNQIFKQYTNKVFNIDKLVDDYYRLGQELKDRVFITDTSLMVEDYLKDGKKVLFEGAQGVMLDINYGTYPFVTSSSPTASSIPMNVGINHKLLGNTLGVVKAYSTRIGAGVFPSEINDEVLAEKIRIKGNEFGTVTKRPRRIGWFDIPLLKHSIRVGGIDYLAITLLDVLSGLDTIRVVIGYVLDGKAITHIPATNKEYNKVKPVYYDLKGWSEDITNTKTYDELPENAKKYIEFIEQELQTKVSMISVGADRSQTIIRDEIF